MADFNMCSLSTSPYGVQVLGDSWQMKRLWALLSSPVWFGSAAVPGPPFLFNAVKLLTQPSSPDQTTQSSQFHPIKMSCRLSSYDTAIWILFPSLDYSPRYMGTVMLSILKDSYFSFNDTLKQEDRDRLTQPPSFCHILQPFHSKHSVK